MLDLQSIALLTIVGIMVVLFLTDHLSPDVTALSGLLFLTIAGFVSSDEAFSGFSSPAVILMLSTFAVSGALRLTGVAENFASRVVTVSGSSEARNVLAVVLLGAFVSAFMNNVAAVAILLPAVAAISKHSSVPPSRLFIPLSFGVLLGGTTTLIGTSPNMLAAEVMRSRGIEPFHFLDFTPFGLALVIVGAAVITIIGRHLLPGGSPNAEEARGDLSELYRLKERMFSLRVPSHSTLSGQSLESLKFAEVLGAEVLAIKRDGTTVLAPHPGDTIVGGDLLIVRGRLPELQALFRLHGVKVEKLSLESLTDIDIPLRAARIRISRKMLASGKTVRELNLRARYGIMVLAIDRNGEIHLSELGSEKLSENDILTVVGSHESMSRLSTEGGFVSIIEELSPRDIFAHGIFALTIPEISALADVRIRDSRFGELVDLTVIGILRDGKLTSAISDDEKIRARDILLVAGPAEHAERLAHLSELIIESDSVESQFESPDVGIMEVVLAPRSKLIGKTIEEIHFREQYGFRVLAMWRDGEPRRVRFSRWPLKFGDALLLQGARNRMPLFAKDSDFVVLTDVQRPRLRTEKGLFAVGGLALMVLLSVFSILPPHIAAALAAVLVVLSGAIRMDEVYREIEWRVVLLVSALLPLALAIERQGVSEMVSSALVSTTGQWGALPLLVVFGVSSSFLSQVLDGTLSVVLLGPIAIEVANRLGLAPHSFMMMVTLAASIAFITPFSHRANLLIMGPGGYRSRDFVRIGLVLTVALFIVLVVLIPYLYRI